MKRKIGMFLAATLLVLMLPSGSVCAVSADLSKADIGKIESLIENSINTYPPQTEFIQGMTLSAETSSQILWNLLYRYYWLDQNENYNQNPYYEKAFNGTGLTKEECDNVLVSALGASYNYLTSGFWGFSFENGMYKFTGADGEAQNYIKILSTSKEGSDYFIYFTYYEGLSDYDWDNGAAEQLISNGMAIVYRNDTSIFDFTLKQCTPSSTTPMAANTSAKGVASDNDFRIRLLRQNGVLIGNSLNDLMLEQTLKREELVVLISRLMAKEQEAKEYDASGLTFKDVAKDNWAASYIAWAQDNNIIKGYDDYRFGFGDVVTGLQTEIMLLRILKYDDANIDNAEEYANSQGINYGISSTDISQAITRSDASLMLYNTLYCYKNHSHDGSKLLIEELGYTDDMSEKQRYLALTLSEFNVEFLNCLEKENNWESIYIECTESTLLTPEVEEYKRLGRALVSVLGFKNIQIIGTDNTRENNRILEIDYYCQDSTNEILAIEVNGVYNYFNLEKAF